MFFSVIVTIYNGEAFLANCLDGVLKNPADNYELIIVDDGSTDNTVKICDDYAERYNHVKCVHTENQGIGNARQTGLDEASGEYVIFVDGDDVWDESFSLGRMEEEIKKSQAELYVFGFILRKTEPNGYSDTHYKVVASLFDDWRDNQAQFLSYFPNGIMFPCWNKIFRRQCITENNIISVNQQMEDFRFVLEFLRSTKKVVFLPDEPYYYMKRGDKSLTSSVHQGMLDGYNCCHSIFLSLFDREYAELIHRIMAPQYIGTINRYLNNIDLDKDAIEAKKMVEDVIGNDLARLSIKKYRANTFSEMITCYLMRNGYFGALRKYRRLVLAVKGNI